MTNSPIECELFSPADSLRMADELAMLRRQNSQLAELSTRQREVIEAQRKSINELCGPGPNNCQDARDQLATELPRHYSVTVEQRAHLSSPSVQWPDGHDYIVWTARVVIPLLDSEGCPAGMECISGGGHTLADALAELRTKYPEATK